MDRKGSKIESYYLSMGLQSVMYYPSYFFLSELCLSKMLAALPLSFTQHTEK